MHQNSLSIAFMMIVLPFFYFAILPEAVLSSTWPDSYALSFSFGCQAMGVTTRTKAQRTCIQDTYSVI